jgi:hypothetical protein
MSEYYDYETIEKEIEDDYNDGKKEALRDAESKDEKINGKNLKSSKNQKHIHKILKTTNQISNNEFNEQIEGYFVDIDEDKYNYFIIETEVDENLLQPILDVNTNFYSLKREISLMERLSGALITHSNTEVNKLLDTFEPEKNFNLKGVKSVKDNMPILEFFKTNNVLESITEEEIPTEEFGNIKDIFNLYKEQVEINNRRKRILKEVIKKE